jgi:hypothetical protein
VKVSNLPWHLLDEDIGEMESNVDEWMKNFKTNKLEMSRGF